MPGSARKGELPRVAQTTRLLSQMVEDLRMRIQASIDKLNKDEVPPEETMKAAKDLVSMNKQNTDAWISLREAVKGLSETASDRALGQGFIRRLEAILTNPEGVTDNELLRIVEKRFGKPVALIENVVEAGASVEDASRPPPDQASPGAPAADPTPEQEEDPWL